MGESYSGVLTELVDDPDCDNLIYQYQNLPDGLSGSGTGVISGSVTRTDNFNVIVTVTDGNDRELSFNFQVRVNSDNTQSSSGSGGGSSHYVILLMLMIYFVTRLNQTSPVRNLNFSIS